ncbi:cytochrome d ubiquinol oxidase subunit II [Sorangium cellulosum]|uniref:Cytochrome BD ubiquinol oxidase subunit II n=1 Tax=Sorangium cellulosum TaxID=56 RepID=A0A150QQV2_SORCE|nr:cytochrome d ubiquinol oxidase subunit II [Sorangium cellulosum]KYF69988.1 cytochrome BD ubiquinol oxidase subunit II [Sorangium cellulosum]
MHVEWLLAGVMVAALILYALFGGADFGGGVWDLLASGPRKQEQRALIERVMGPIWEANHVWLILAIVLLFTAFPPAFAAISIALHVPLTLFLVGVVFRGSAFSFRSYDSRGDRQQKRWGFVFSLASVIAPVLLGMIVGAVASGRIRVASGVVTSGFFASWLSLFPFVVGLFALALFAFLAAVYLTNEATEPALVDDFRRRALLSGGVVAALALASFAASYQGAPLIREGLTDHPITWPLHVTTGLAATAAFFALWTRRFRLARLAAAAQVTLILLGWAASQYPFLVVPDVTLAGAASNPKTLRLLVWVLGVGFVLLFPSLYVLFRIFGSGRAGAAHDGDEAHERE